MTLKMVTLHHIIIALAFCIPLICCIGIDYVLTDEKEYEEPLQNTTNVSSIERRVGKYAKTVSQINLNELEMNKASILKLYETDSEENEDVSLKTKATIVTIAKQYGPIFNSTRIFHYKEASTAMPDSRQILDLIDEFYEDETDGDESHPVARNRQANDRKILELDTTDSNPTSSLNMLYNKPYMPDFYNLAPVKLELSSNLASSYFNSSKRKVSKIWYVPEEYPCWELPLLYGAPDPVKRSKEVFRISERELKNIRKSNSSKKYTKTHTNKKLPAKEALEESKWCEIQPCYGDHTLCLFSKYKVSKICDSGYHVIAPTTLERIAIANTINSMRNRVASGLAETYQHLPKAANMQQIMYDNDLEMMAAVWLHQCLPGPAPCSALYNEFVTQLECTKYARHCCTRKRDAMNETW